MIQGRAGAAPLAVVAVGLTVAAADRRVDRRAGNRFRDSADPLEVLSADAMSASIAELPAGADPLVGATASVRVVLTGALVAQGDVAAEALTVIGVGDPVATADRLVDLRARVVARLDADAHHVGAAGAVLALVADQASRALKPSETSALRRFGRAGVRRRGTAVWRAQRRVRTRAPCIC